VTDGRRIIIGDIHGHYDGLMTLLDTVALNDADQVYFLGDLIDRGPDSAKVVQFVRDSGHTSLLGNHEQLLLEAFPNGEVSTSSLQAWLYSGGQSTLMSYESPAMVLDQLEWLNTLPTHLDLGNIWLVHAGLHPGLPLNEQTRHEFCWIRDSFHGSTRPYFVDKLIITGHTITFTFPGVPAGSLVKGCGWLDIDTGAYHPRSGWLTAVEIDTDLHLTDQLLAEQRVHQVNVFTGEARSLALGEVMIPIGPGQARSRRRQMMQVQK